MRRTLTLGAAACALVGCRAQPPVSPSGPLWELEVSRVSMLAGAPALQPITLRLTAGSRGAEAEGRLFVGFPHWTHALRGEAGRSGSPTPEELRVRALGPGGELGASIRRARLEHWYVQVELPRDVPPGGSVSIELDGLTAPVSAVQWELRVLADPQGGDDPILVGTQPVPVLPGSPHALTVHAPSQVVTGSPVRVGLRLEDRFGNPTEGLPPAVNATFERYDVGRGAIGRVGAAPPPTAEVPVSRTEFGLTGRVELPGPGPRPWRLRIEGDFPGGFALSEPFRAVEAPPDRVIWADLHGHGVISDGASAPDSWFRYARDVSFLDAAALSEHDWQTSRPESAALLAASVSESRAAAFVAIPAVETNISGHEVGLIIDTAAMAALAPGVDPASPGGVLTLWEETDFGMTAAPPSPSAATLVAALGRGILMGSHSTLAPSMGTGLPLQKGLPTPLTLEMYSAHGNSECRECERSAWHEPRGDDGRSASVRQLLGALPPVAIVAAGDSHDGRPGNSRWGGAPGGLTALRVRELSPSGIAEAIRERRTWATTGRRTILELRFGEESDGAIVGLDEQGPIRVRVTDRERLDRIEFVRDGAVAHTVRGDSRGGWVEWKAPPVSGPSWTYVKAVFADGEMAWTSPLYVTAEESRPAAPESPPGL